MLKSIFPIIAILIVSVACTEIVFETPQPSGSEALKEIPSSLQGNYTFVLLNEQQVLKITDEYFEGEDGKKYLSDSVVLKKLGDKYVINQLNGEGETEGKWSVFMLEEKGCGFLKATALIVSEDEYVQSFSEMYAATMVGGGQEKQLIINPTDKQFKAITKDSEATLSVILEKLE